MTDDLIEAAAHRAGLIGLAWLVGAYLFILGFIFLIGFAVRELRRKNPG
jgi:hypothetical protein